MTIIIKYVVFFEPYSEFFSFSFLWLVSFPFAPREEQEPGYTEQAHQGAPKPGRLGSEQLS